jgi:succinyl-CoA synthetase beta subunit
MMDGNALMVTPPRCRCRRWCALADTLVSVLRLAMHLEGQLAELDINPLMVLPRGQGVKAVDALVVFSGT